MHVRFVRCPSGGVCGARDRRAAGPPQPVGWNGQRVQIRFLDLGPDPEVRNYRYNCEAWVVDERGNQVSERGTGNGASSWDTALSIIQWHWLEQPGNRLSVTSSPNRATTSWPLSAVGVFLITAMSPSRNPVVHAVALHLQQVVRPRPEGGGDGRRHPLDDVGIADDRLPACWPPCRCWRR